MSTMAEVDRCSVLILLTSATVQLMSRVVLDSGIHVTLDPLDHGHDPVNWPDPNFGLTFLAEVKLAVTPLCSGTESWLQITKVHTSNEGKLVPLLA
jgi:hypothetical protein